MTERPDANLPSVTSLESEAHARELIALIAQAIWEMDAHGSMVKDSPSWRAYTGQSFGEHSSFGWLSAIHPDDRRGAEAQWRAAVAEKNKLNIEVRLHHNASESHRWTNLVAVPISGADHSVQKWIGIAIDIHEQKTAIEYQNFLIAEFQHRVRNILANIRAIVSRTVGEGAEVETFRAHLDGRIGALARIQNMLARSPGQGIDLEMVIRDELLAQVAAGDRITLTGPQTRMPTKTAEVISLAIHELVTNAIKFGALKDGDGSIHMTWSLSARDNEDWLTLDWVEQSKEPFNLEQPSGFGTELITRRIPYELKGATTIEHGATGLRVHMSIPLRDGGTLDTALNKRR